MRFLIARYVARVFTRNRIVIRFFDGMEALRNAETKAKECFKADPKNLYATGTTAGQHYVAAIGPNGLFVEFFANAEDQGDRIEELQDDGRIIALEFNSIHEIIR